MRNEPIRWAIWLASGTTALAVFFQEWARGGDWKLAVGLALGAFALPAAGGELARSQAYAPSTVDDLLDADTVISKAEQGQ